MLLPVYVGHSKFRKKNYNFYVNGQNGNVAGKTPVSPVKISVLSLIGVAIGAKLGDKFEKKAEFIGGLILILIGIKILLEHLGVINF